MQDGQIIKLSTKNCNDFQGLFETLSHLSPAPSLSKKQVSAIIERLEKSHTYVFVMTVNKKIVASTTLMIEKKLLRNGALCGHIEDVVTHKDYIKLGYSSRLLTHSIKFAKKLGCYKIVLYCEDKLENFYHKLGFKLKGISMEKRF